MFSLSDFDHCRALKITLDGPFEYPDFTRTAHALSPVLESLVIGGDFLPGIAVWGKARNLRSLKTGKVTQESRKEP